MDSSIAKAWGFTSDNYQKWSYLRKQGKYIYIFMIDTLIKPQREDYFTELITNILKSGFTVKVPIPIDGMPAVIEKMGFTKTYEWNVINFTNMEVWILHPPKPGGDNN